MDTKNYFEVVASYKKLVNEMDTVIKRSGFKTSFLADNLRLSRSAFYTKRKKGTFTVSEVEQLLHLIVSTEKIASVMDNIDNKQDNDEIEDAYFMKIHEERKDEPAVPLRDYIAKFNAKHHKEKYFQV